MNDARTQPVSVAEAVMAVLAVAWIIGMPIIASAIGIFAN